MKFLLLSDLHLELKKNESVKLLNKIIYLLKQNKDLKYVLLCGDVGNPLKDKHYFVFIKRLSKYAKKIFLTTGNHEYYNFDGNIRNTKNLYEWIKLVDLEIQNNLPPNAFLLQNSFVHLQDGDENFIIFGATYWTDIPDGVDLSNSELNDYCEIPFFNKKDVNELNSTSKTILSNCLNSNIDKNFIIMTHHVPKIELLYLNKNHVRSELDHAYGNSTFGFETANQIRKWVFGHLHIPIDHGIFVSNPIGYTKELFYKLKIVHV